MTGQIPFMKRYKYPAARLDYSIVLTKELTRLEDTIADVQWVVPSAMSDGAGNAAITLDDDIEVSFDNDSPSPVFETGGVIATDYIASIFIDGGTSGQSYVIEGRVTTTDGREYVGRIEIGIL